MACIAVVLILITLDVVHRRVRWYLIAWFVIAACAFLQWPLWSLDSIRAQLPLWFWQLVLLPTGVVMAVSPLVNAVRAAGAKPPVSQDLALPDGEAPRSQVSHPISNAQQTDNLTPA